MSESKTQTTGASASPADLVGELLAGVGLPASLAGRVEIDGTDPVLDSPYRLGEAAAAAAGACAAAATALWEARGGEPQNVRVDVGRAAAALNGWAELRLDGAELAAPHLGNPFYDSFRCRDGRWLQLQAGLPNLVERTLRVLRCGPGRDEIAAAMVARDAAEWEAALAAGDACGTVVRTVAEWEDTPQGRELRRTPLVELRELGPAPREPLEAADRPLAGIRVLDLTRVIAGPVHGRSLAEHGAEVLRISSPQLPDVLSAALDTGFGKRSAYLDLRVPRQRERLWELAAEADVFAQGYRPGALASHGFDPAGLAELRPGIVHASVSCFGDTGPLSPRRGWEQIAQAATGIAAGQGSPEEPNLLPAAACDYVTGYLAALGSIAALLRRGEDGGSYAVGASLCRTAMWIQDLGTGAADAKATGPCPAPDWTDEAETNYGRLRHMTPIAQLSRTPARWSRPAEPPGSSAARWSSGPEVRSGGR